MFRIGAEQRGVFDLVELNFELVVESRDVVSSIAQKVALVVKDQFLVFAYILDPFACGHG